jgi:CBS domain-containing protein
VLFFPGKLRESAMSLTQFAVPTAVAVPGMTVRELFTECVRADVAGLPFRAASGDFTGKASIRHVLREVCIPQAMIDHARLLGDDIEALRFPRIRKQWLLEQTIDDFILRDLPTVTPASPLAKALAIMESHGTTYLFVIDADIKYYGTLSIVSLARRLLKPDP